MDELTREFLIESQEGLDRMERCLTELEERPQDGELLADIFRSVHTIKGTTGFLGYSRLEKLSHAGENLLGMLRDGKLVANEEIISTLLQLLDDLRAILQSIENDNSEGQGDDHAMIERLHALQHGEAVAVAESVELVESVEIAAETKTKKAGKRRAPARSNSAEAAGSEAAPEAAPKPAAEPVAGVPQQRAQVSAADSTLRVDITLLNQMMNLVGELVLTRNQILQATNTDVAFAPLSRRLDMVTSDLREAVMKVRMQPVSHVFSKFPRLVRDLAQQLDKQIHLELEGQETELDKSLLEAIKDPLTHLVRNSCDHGIEMPAAREAAGKNPAGTLRLRAYQEGSHVLIEVADDGGGIRVEKIRDKALERKLITQEKVAQLSERELLQLIFLPGFSTAAAVTNVSGRGVGMDVVRNNVEKIGGKVEIESRPGKGTTLRLRIPLTLAIVPALIVSSRSQSFALPQGALFELVHLTPEERRTQIEWLENAPLYRLRGKLLPLVYLSRMLEQGEDPEVEAGCYIAVLNADGRRYGLVIDGLADPEEIVVKPLSSALKEIGLFSGATLMGNGEMALILDPAAIAVRAEIGLSEEEEEEQDQASAALASEGEEFLLVETGEGTAQAALPLSEVLRIERIERGRVEHIGRTPVLRFDGVLLPLEDSSGLLDDVSQAAEMTVIVCREGTRHVGITVAHVLDVATGSALSEAGTNAVAAGVTLLRERVTEVVNLSRIPVLPGPAAGPIPGPIPGPIAITAELEAEACR
ncbi:chemotaxis protein CheA [Silvibacterium acidisoli]|uniref:chemotaxis protein CheA n=1 Tax=Acidobacteriaceae bacterium ZG23-2 TaxID=2883246 RepID=UPI00406C03E4